jgi:hypothetical protein
MNKKRDEFKIFFLIIAIASFVTVLLRAWFIPFTHDEAATFFFYVQNGSYLPFLSHPYTNNHILNSAFSDLFYRLYGSHPFALRLPNVISFTLFIIGTYRLSLLIKNFWPKVLLCAFLFCNIAFLDFFSLCRGYGISMSFLLLSLTFLFNYFITKRFSNLVLFSILAQTALSANLTIILPISILIGLIILFQLKEKKLFSFGNLVLHLLNLLLILFWLKLTFYYQSKGLLDSGLPENYWETTFKSLMLLVFASNHSSIQVACVMIFTVITYVAARKLLSNTRSLQNLFSLEVFAWAVLSFIILAFFLLNKTLGINFPEDRTALFIYLLFIVSLCFALDQLGKKIQQVITITLFAPMLTLSINVFSFTSFTHYFYHVLPDEFYSVLKKEQEKSEELLTVGGNTTREMVYSYANYRIGSSLNAMDQPEEMHMNCDYYVALRSEKPYYDFFYNEIASDKEWDRVLLKRKTPILRKTILSVDEKVFNNNEEYVGLFGATDTLLKSKNCLELYTELEFKRVPKPFNAYLVLQIDDEEGNMMYYKRVILNFIADDLNGQSKRFKLTTGPIKKKPARIVGYIWNMDKQNIHVSLKKLRLCELQGEGINLIVPGEYYEMARKLSDKVLL